MQGMQCAPQTPQQLKLQLAPPPLAPQRSTCATLLKLCRLEAQRPPQPPQGMRRTTYSTGVAAPAGAASRGAPAPRVGRPLKLMKRRQGDSEGIGRSTSSLT